MAYNRDNNLFSLSKYCDRDYDSYSSEENLYGSYINTRKSSTPNQTVPETPCHIEPSKIVTREDSPDTLVKPHVVREVPIHDTGYLSMKEPQKHKVSFSDERFPLLGFVQREITSPKMQTNKENNVSEMRQVREMSIQTVMPPEPYRDNVNIPSVSSRDDTQLTKESQFSFKPNVLSAPVHTASVPSIIPESSIPMNSIRKGMDNLQSTCTSSYREPLTHCNEAPGLVENKFPFQSSLQEPFWESQVTLDRPPFHYNSDQREITDDSFYRLPQRGPPYPLNPCQTSVSSNFDQLTQSQIFLHSNVEHRVPIYSQGSKFDPLRQSSTIFDGYSQSRDNFCNPTFSVSGNLAQNIPSQVMNPPLRQMPGRPVQVMGSNFNNPVGQALNSQMGSNFNNPVGQALNSQMGSNFNNPVGQALNSQTLITL